MVQNPSRPLPLCRLADSGDAKEGSGHAERGFAIAGGVEGVMRLGCRGQDLNLTSRRAAVHGLGYPRPQQRRSGCMQDAPNLLSSDWRDRFAFSPTGFCPARALVISVCDEAARRKAASPAPGGSRREEGQRFCTTAPPPPAAGRLTAHLQRSSCHCRSGCPRCCPPWCGWTGTNSAFGCSIGRQHH